ncbi:MAG TPA: mannosyltransferase family protein, partial [Thermomicrobiaceae bacterium]|nr:mannosyltransferase family protein [Thermomicrobiaceae bacterium]
VAVRKPSKATVMQLRSRLAGQLREHGPMLVDVGLAFLLSQLLFYVVAIVAFAFVAPYSGHAYQPWSTHAPRLIDASWRWDSGWYSYIAQHGYVSTPGFQGVAFFPLFPYILRAFYLILPASWYFFEGVVINHVIFALSLIPVWLYAERIGGRKVAQRTLFLLCIFPAALFFNAIYTEALFLLFSSLALVLFQRDRFGSAGVAGFFACLTRSFGIFLAVSGLIYAGVRWLRDRDSLSRTIWRVATLALIPLGIVVFMLMQLHIYGDPTLFLKVQTVAGWSHVKVFPLVSLYHAADYSLYHHSLTVINFMDAVNTGALAIALILGLVLLRSDPAGAVYSLLSVLLVLATPSGGDTLMSGARYVAVLFPIFVMLGRWAERRWFLGLLTVIFLPLSVALTILFVRWYWVV